MPRVAILADIHGNLPALEAVRADLARVAPDVVIVAGDVINRGPQSKACLQAIRATGWTVLFGNHEDYVLKLADGSLPTPGDERDWWLPAARVAEDLSAEELAYLAALPREHVVEPSLVEGVKHHEPRAPGGYRDVPHPRPRVRAEHDPVVVRRHAVRGDGRPGVIRDTAVLERGLPVRRRSTVLHGATVRSRGVEPDRRRDVVVATSPSQEERQCASPVHPDTVPY